MAIDCIYGLCFDVGLVVVSEDSVGLFEFIAEKDVGEAFECGSWISGKFVFECFPVDGVVHIVVLLIIVSLLRLFTIQKIYQKFFLCNRILLSRKSLSSGLSERKRDNFFRRFVFFQIPLVPLILKLLHKFLFKHFWCIHICFFKSIFL